MKYLMVGSDFKETRTLDDDFFSGSYFIRAREQEDEDLHVKYASQEIESFVAGLSEIKGNLRKFKKIADNLS